MATPVSGLRTAKSILEKDAGDDISRVIDFQLAELSVGVQVLQVIAQFWSLETVATVNFESNPALGTLNYGTAPAVSEFQGGDPTTGGFEVNSEQYMLHYLDMMTQVDTTNGTGAASVSGAQMIWTPPEPVLLVRNTLHRKQQDAATQVAHTVIMHYRYVRLTRDEQIMLFGRGT